MYRVKNKIYADAGCVLKYENKVAFSFEGVDEKGVLETKLNLENIHPLRALLCPQGSASSGRGGGVRTTGQGTGTAWSREPRSPPSVGTTWRSQKGLAFGLKALTAPPLC